MSAHALVPYCPGWRRCADCGRTWSPFARAVRFNTICPTALARDSFGLMRELPATEKFTVVTRAQREEIRRRRAEGTWPL